MVIFDCCIDLLFLSFLLLKAKYGKLEQLRQLIIKNRTPALIVSLIFFLGEAIGTLRLSGILTGLCQGIVFFCLSSTGFAFAEYNRDFSPLPVTKSFAQREGRAKTTLSFLLFAVILFVLLILLGMFVPQICFAVFHEPDLRKEAVTSIPSPNKVLAFPLLLAEAGIAEESVFRLLFQSLFRCVLKLDCAAILLSSLCFALYHLSPLDSMYLVYWHFPLTQFTSVFISGIALGWFYRRFGFETVVLGHTLSDYLSVMMTAH